MPEEITATCNYISMECSLYFDDELIKTFNLNKGKPGEMWGWFMYQHEEAPYKMKYHVQLELSDRNRRQLSRPRLYIHPMHGKYVIKKGPTYVETTGDWETYLDNHKHYDR